MLLRRTRANDRALLARSLASRNRCCESHESDGVTMKGVLTSRKKRHVFESTWSVLEKACSMPVVMKAPMPCSSSDASEQNDHAASSSPPRTCVPYDVAQVH